MKLKQNTITESPMYESFHKKRQKSCNSPVKVHSTKNENAKNINLNIATSRFSENSYNNLKNPKIVFKMYTQEGFLSFVEDLLSFLTPKDISDLGLDFEILNEMEEHANARPDSPQIRKKLTDFFNFSFIEEEGSV